MKGIIRAAVVGVAAATLAGCIAVPAYEPVPAYSYYYPAPAPAMSFYYSNRSHWHHRHHRHHYHGRHW